MTMKKSRVVFDCMIFLQAVTSDKSLAFRLFEYFENGSFTVYVSNAVLAEITEVLNRPFVRTANPSITNEYVEDFLKRFLMRARSIKSVPPKFKYSRDPKDEKYINLAIEAEADYLISHDRDLLDLMTGIDDECKQFRQRFRHLKIIQPVDFLNIVSGKDMPLNP